MFRCLVFFIFIFTTPVFNAVTEKAALCSPDEFSCGDGSCVALSAVCDGRADCAGQHDERGCDGDWNRRNKPHLIWTREKRQATSCEENQFQCRDGSCIGLDGRCNGAVDCVDGSDETFPQCRKDACESDQFKCMYGACIDNALTCNGKKDCADNSDELIPRCRNQTGIIGRSGFRCGSGQYIEPGAHCNGARDCSDGSDETLEACAGKNCRQYLYHCAYGGCTWFDAECNGRIDCIDGSDESDEICNRISPGVTTTPEPTTPAANCQLPPYPTYGTYSVHNEPNAVPGQSYTSVLLNIICYPGYGAEDNRDSILCHDGTWSSAMPKCVRFCRLNKHSSVEYRCLSTGAVTGSRECSTLEPAGTVVQPICRYPNYYYPGILSNMNCIDGSWDYVAQCKPECGTVAPDAKLLIFGGRSAKKGELPWHAGIYSKLYKPYMQVCGGSLISNTAVISAAHCFWSESDQKLPEINYAVGVGKLYRPWSNPRDDQAQTSEIAEIRLTSRYQGSGANFQDDIAVVIVTTPFIYTPYIRPVCVDFDPHFDKQQTRPGTYGKVAGWGFTTRKGKASQNLKVVDMPMVSIDQCRAFSPPSFRVHLTSDKICAGYTDGTTLCQGDSGGGLVFPAVELATERYYLRGVVSVSPISADACTIGTLVTFTKVTKHEHFIKESL